MRKSLAILILAILTFCLPTDAFAQWGASSRNVDLRLNNGSRFVGLESTWNSVPEYAGTLYLPDGTRIMTMQGGPRFNANFQPTGGTYYKLTPSGQLSSLVYYGGRLTGEYSMSGMSYRIENTGIVVYHPNASGGSGGSYSGDAYSGGSYSGGSSTSGSSSGSTYQSRGTDCAGCHGSGLCQRCNGTGLNAQNNRCSLCGGQKRCRSCGGTGKIY